MIQAIKKILQQRDEQFVLDGYWDLESWQADKIKLLWKPETTNSFLNQQSIENL